MTPEEYLSVICPTMLTVSGYNRFITVAENYTSSGFFGEHYAEAVALRAAHLFTINYARGGEAGMVTQKSEGRMSVSFGGMAASNNSLASTGYGSQLMDMIQTLRAGGTVSDTYVFDTYLGG